MEYGNIQLSKIMVMEINTLGNALFCDTDFIKSSNKDPEWTNFKQKIRKEKNINLENTILVQDRVKKCVSRIKELIYGTNDSVKITDIVERFNEEQETVRFADILFTHMAFDFFELLKTNISNFLPCDICQHDIARYTFAKCVNKLVNYSSPKIKGSALPIYERKKMASMIEKSFLYFFKKNNMGLYEPTLDNANKAIKNAFKNTKKKLDILKETVDTDKNRNLSNPSTSWKTYKKLLNNEKGIFNNIDENSAISYKQSYFIYMLLKNFEKAIDEFIPHTVQSKMIEDILNNIDYLKSLKDLRIGEPHQRGKIPETAMEYILYVDNREYFPCFEFDIDFFYYNRETPEAMQPMLNYGSQEEYIDYIFKYTNKKCGFSKESIYGNDTFCEEEVSYFLNNLCSEEKIGKSSPFFFKWYSARIEYAAYRQGKSTIEKVSQVYLDAYDIGLYFAGKYTSTFAEEAIRVFLEEYKETKRTGRIKEVYQYATALGITKQLYKAFKDSEFNDPVINPHEFYIELWDSGYTVIDIARLTGLSWQTIQNILMNNKKFLKRNDENSIHELEMYITKQECDEYDIESDEIWD